MRSHNGYLLRFDEEGILFDPGEGAQRQLLLAGVAVSAITRICVTHFHGDHCLGLPGVIQRMALDGVAHQVPVHFPASGQEYFDRLRRASIFLDRAPVVPHPLKKDGRFGWFTAKRLRHPVDTFGYRLAEPDGRRMLPELLERHGIRGPAIGRLQKEGGPLLDAVSEVKPGQIVAFVMDTGVCDAAVELAADADLLVIESTFLEGEKELAAIAGHLTAAQAGRIATAAGARKLVLTHFSQRYPDSSAFGDEAARHFHGEIVVASELERIPLPPRRSPTARDTARTG
jgi:ribonuclease Z